MAWRRDIDALTFQPDGRGAFCVVHRRAFRTLMRIDPTPAECEVFFRVHCAAFEAAATAKIRAGRLADGLNFHLTSRDVARQMGSSGIGGSAKV